MTAESIAHALNARRSGTCWMAKCPAHDDNNPSLSIREADGRVLLHCHAGCTQGDVIDALTARGPKRVWNTTLRICAARQSRRICSLFQSPQYNNGTPLPGLGGLPGLDRIGGGTPSGGGLVIQLDGPATTALLQGQAVQAIADNPRLIQSATMAATKSNANRRELTSLQLSPGTIVS
jgi:CHC2 zinc finger